jgi:hypothetical protein
MQLRGGAREVLVTGRGRKHPQLPQRDVLHAASILRRRYS